MKDPKLYKPLFDEKKCCVIIPTYNNDQTICQVITDVLEYTNNVYVVNDGSTDSTSSLLKEFEDKVTIISYTQNIGKGNALQFGFRKAYEDGFLYAISIDSDGQHYASDLPNFIDVLDEHPNAVIIGARKPVQENKSKGSKFANKFSNFWFTIETGLNVEDTQSGYRLYPLHPISETYFYTKKYEFEIEIIVRLSWKAVEVTTVPIDVFYPKKEERVSHFRPFQDFSRISVLNTVLVFLALIYFLPRNFSRLYKSKPFKEVLRDDIFQLNSSIKIISISIGFGVFMGIFPVWGYQLIIGFIVAYFLKLNKAIFFIFANISIPPMIPIILYLSYVVGGYALGRGSWMLDLNDFTVETIKSNIFQYIFGAVLLSIVAGLVFSASSYFALSFYRNNKRNKG